jgi:hypothetical protein
MIIRVLRVNTIALLIILIAFLLISGACATGTNNSMPVQRQGSNFSGDPDSCSMCHVDVEIEILKAETKHMKAGIDCITCHGLSIGHIQNEINEVKPDRIIAKKSMNSFCHGCHNTSASHDEKVISRMVCTSCHDAHATFIPGR